MHLCSVLESELHMYMVKEKCVALILDEMHIKQDLVFDEHTGMLPLNFCALHSGTICSIFSCFRCYRGIHKLR